MPEGEAELARLQQENQLLREMLLQERDMDTKASNPCVACNAKFPVHRRA